MSRTLSDEDIEGIAQRMAALVITGASATRRIEPDAIYTVPEAAKLIGMHPCSLRKKLRACVVKGSRRLGDWRIRGAELLKMG